VLYDQWKEELIIQPNVKRDEMPEKTSVEDKKIIDHPLSVNQNSQWNMYYKD
jgi:hypothetical protein